MFFTPSRLIYENNRPPKSADFLASRAEDLPQGEAVEFREERDELRGEVENGIYRANLERYKGEVVAMPKSLYKSLQLGNPSDGGEEGQFEVPVFAKILKVDGVLDNLRGKYGRLIFKPSRSVPGECEVVLEMKRGVSVPIVYSADYKELLDAVDVYRRGMEGIHDGLNLLIDRVLFRFEAVGGGNKQFLVTNFAGQPICTVKQVGELPTGKVEYEIWHGEKRVGNCAIGTDHNLEPMRDVIRKLL